MISFNVRPGPRIEKLHIMLGFDSKVDLSVEAQPEPKRVKKSFKPPKASKEAKWVMDIINDVRFRLLPNLDPATFKAFKYDVDIALNENV